MDECERGSEERKRVLFSIHSIHPLQNSLSLSAERVHSNISHKQQ